MPITVQITADALEDLREIGTYIAGHDSADKAAYVLGEIMKAIDSLSTTPERGVYPKEMLAFGTRDFREIFFKPYRIVYTVIKPKVYVLLIADGRRDMRALLQRRLLES